MSEKLIIYWCVWKSKATFLDKSVSFRHFEAENIFLNVFRFPFNVINIFFLGSRLKIGHRKHEIEKGNVLRKVCITSIFLCLYLSNLWIWSDFRAFDPENCQLFMRLQVEFTHTQIWRLCLDGPKKIIIDELLICHMLLLLLCEEWNYSVAWARWWCVCVLLQNTLWLTSICNQNYAKSVQKINSTHLSLAVALWLTQLQSENDEHLAIRCEPT